MSLGTNLRTSLSRRVSVTIQLCTMRAKSPRPTLIKCNSLPNLFRDISAQKAIILIRITLMKSTKSSRIIKDISYSPEYPDDYRFDVGNEHELVADVDAETLIKLVKFLKRGKAPGPDTIHNEVLRLGTTTSLFHPLAKLFTSSIQLDYIPTAWKLATLHMLLKPDKLPSLTTSYRPVSLISSIMKLFERVIEQWLRSHLEHIGFINKHQSGFRKAKSTDDHLFRLSQSIMESFNRGEHVVAAFLMSEKYLTQWTQV